MTNRTLVRVILTAIAIFAALYFLYLIRTVLGMLFISAFLAVALGPIVEWLVRRGLGRTVAILLTYLALLATVFGIGLLVVPPIVSGVDDFTHNVPTYVTDLRNSKTFRQYDNKYKITPKLEEQARKLPTHISDAVSGLRAVTVGIFGTVVQLVTILVMAFFLLKDGRKIMEFIFRELGPERGGRMAKISEDVYAAVGGYVAGNVLISVIAGVGAYIVMTILNIPFAVPLAVLVAFFDLIPLVGSTIAGVVVGIVAAVVGFPGKLIVWVIYLIVYQQVENNVIQPVVYRRTVAIHPLIVIVAVLIGGSLLGVLGALLAIPIAATVQIVVKEWWQYRRARLLPDNVPPPAVQPEGGPA
ncbi:MAG TPA: AI-2E family transporter [Thermoleophilaceae bacterium]|nr:AI-2E family transporter [Thermoleophilaceae bacterium]